MWLDELRKKPKSTRDQYAFLGAIGITSVIAVIWLVSLSVQFSSETQIVRSETEATSGAFSRVFSDAKTQIAEVFSTLRPPQESESQSEFATSTASTSEDKTATTTAPSLFRFIPDSPPSPVGRTILIETTTSPQKVATSSTDL